MKTIQLIIRMIIIYYNALLTIHEQLNAQQSVIATVTGHIIGYL